jgi:hypothetical protein
MFISLGNLFAFFSDTKIFYVFNCFYVFLQKEINNTKNSLRNSRIFTKAQHMSTCNPKKNVWTIKSTRCHHFSISLLVVA